MGRTTETLRERDSCYWPPSCCRPTPRAGIQETRHNADNGSIVMPSKAETPCRNRGFLDWDRSDLNREPKDYESVSGCCPTTDNVETCGVLGFSVAPKVALATAENGCERLTLVAESDPGLARLVAAWPRLSATAKRMILAALEAEQDQVP